LTALLPDHQITEARKLGRERISNGELLRLAEGAGFDLCSPPINKIRYQQNLKRRRIAIVVLGQSPWGLVRLHLERLEAAVNAATPGSYTEVEIPFK
jgi:hypothetical protein